MTTDHSKHYPRRVTTCAPAASEATACLKFFRRTLLYHLKHKSLRLGAPTIHNRHSRTAPRNRRSRLARLGLHHRRIGVGQYCWRNRSHEPSLPVQSDMLPDPPLPDKPPFPEAPNTHLRQMPSNQRAGDDASISWSCLSDIGRSCGIGQKLSYVWIAQSGAPGQ